jgi:hypothetical protein
MIYGDFSNEMLEPFRFARLTMEVSSPSKSLQLAFFKLSPSPEGQAFGRISEFKEFRSHVEGSA